MELAELAAYAEEKYHIREQRRWSDFPGFSVLCDPRTGRWIALLMRQWDGERGVIDIVNIRVNILRVVSIVHYGYFDRHTLFFSFQINNIIEQMGTMTIDIANEFFQAFDSVEYFLTSFSCFSIWTKVSQCNADTSV